MSSSIMMGAPVRDWYDDHPLVAPNFSSTPALASVATVYAGLDTTTPCLRETWPEIAGMIKNRVRALYRRRRILIYPETHVGLYIAGSEEDVQGYRHDRMIILVLELEEQQKDSWRSLHSAAQQILEDFLLDDRGVCIRYYIRDGARLAPSAAFNAPDLVPAHNVPDPEAIVDLSEQRSIAPAADPRPIRRVPRVHLPSVSSRRRRPATIRSPPSGYPGLSMVGDMRRQTHVAASPAFHQEGEETGRSRRPQQRITMDRLLRDDPLEPGAGESGSSQSPADEPEEEEEPEPATAIMTEYTRLAARIERTSHFGYSASADILEEYYIHTNTFSEPEEIRTEPTTSYDAPSDLWVDSSSNLPHDEFMKEMMDVERLPETNESLAQFSARARREDFNRAVGLVRDMTVEEHARVGI